MAGSLSLSLSTSLARLPYALCSSYSSPLMPQAENPQLREATWQTKVQHLQAQFPTSGAQQQPEHEEELSGGENQIWK